MTRPTSDTRHTSARKTSKRKSNDHDEIDEKIPADKSTTPSLKRENDKHTLRVAPYVTSKWAARGLAALAGVLYFVGFAGFDVWPLSMFSTVPLLAALRGRTTREAFRLGTLMGFVSMAGGFYWIVSMLQTFSGFNAIVCSLFASLLWIAQGLQFGLMSMIVVRADVAKVPRIIALPAAIGVMELLYPLLFPWYTAASLHNVPTLIQTADLGGPILITMMMFALHAGIEHAWLGPAYPSANTSLKLHSRWVPLAVASALWVCAIPYGVWRIHQVDEENKSVPALRVGIVQENLGLMEKRNDPEKSLLLHLEHTRDLEQQGAQLVVWSESALSFYFAENVKDISRVIPIWRSIHVPILFGALSDRNDKPYNTAFMTDRDGRVLGTYDKTFLLAFGEYLPGGETFPVFYKWSPKSGHFQAGNRQVALPLPPTSDGHTHTVMPLICYEDILPRFVNGFQQQTNSSLLAVILNDAWFGDSTEPPIHFALSKFRSIEHRRDFVRAANSGVSGFVDAAGRVIRAGGTFRPEAFVATVHLRTRKTLYDLLGDWPGYLAVGAALWILWRSRSPRTTVSAA